MNIDVGINIGNNVYSSKLFNMYKYFMKMNHYLLELTLIAYSIEVFYSLT